MLNAQKPKKINDKLLLHFVILMELDKHGQDINKHNHKDDILLEEDKQ